MNMGKRNYSPIGIEIGDTSIKMAQLKKTPRGWAVRDMLVKEMDLSKDGKGERRSDTIVQIIKECMKESSFSGRSVVSAMPGNQLDILPVKIALLDDESVEEAILQKARAHLSYDVENAVIDYIPVEDDETGSEKGRLTRYLLISAQRENVDDHLSILKRARLRPLVLDISACALARLISFTTTHKDNNVLAINAGNRHTSLTLVWRNNILLVRSIPWGRENLITSLMNRLKLDQQKAEGLLSRNGLHAGQNEETAQEDERMSRDSKTSEVVYGILAQQVETLSKEIDKVFQYFSSEMRGAVIDVLYVMGSSSTVRDLDIYLGKRAGISAERFDPFGKLIGGAQGTRKDVNGEGAYFGVPVGLAMRGITDKDIGT